MSEAYPTHFDSDLATVLNPERTSYRPGPLGEADQMHDIAATVSGVGLPQLMPGFLMYEEVTRLVAANKDHFDDWEKLYETIVRFSSYAKLPIDAHIEGQRHTIHDLWQDIYYPPDIGRLTDIATFRLFWKPHIVLDLPNVLADTNTQLRHKRDYFKISTMLDEAAAIVSEKYLSMPRYIGQIGLKMMMTDVHIDRKYAWRDGQRILHAVDTPHEQQRRQQIHDRAIRRSRTTYAVTQFAIDQTFQRLGGSTSFSWQDIA